MPCDAGRNVAKLAELSRRTGVHIVAPTGLHHERFYGPAHWSATRVEDELADLFVADVVDGHRRARLLGPVVRRTDHRAGVIKVAGSDGGPSPRDRRSSRRPPRPIARTGVPILTHCEAGTGALEQLRLLADAGVAARHIVAEPRRQGRRPRLPPRAAGDAARSPSTTRPFRWGDRPNGTLQLLEWAVADGLRRPGRARHGCRAAGLLPASTVARPAALAARRVHRGDGRSAGIDAAGPRRRLFVDEPGAGVRLRRADRSEVSA